MDQKYNIGDPGDKAKIKADEDSLKEDQAGEILNGDDDEASERADED